MRIWFFEVNYVGFTERLTSRKVEKIIKAEWKRTKDFVHCVKRHRELTGSFLMTSKDEVERILNYRRGGQDV